MTLIEEIKLRIRLKTNAFDEGEIIPLINACKADMIRAGVKAPIDEEEPLQRQCIKFYCQAYFGKDTDAERYRICYEQTRNDLAMLGDD